MGVESRTLTIRCDTKSDYDWCKRFRAICDDEGLNKSKLIKRWIKQFVEKKERERAILEKLDTEVKV